MIARYRALVELALACAALVGAAVSWLHARSTVGVAPIADGQPVTMSVVYDPQQLLLTMLLGMVAGVLTVIGMTRLRRARPEPSPSPGEGQSQGQLSES
jgi:NO-binding membrane sensor protein with MHYT domain